MTIDITQLFAPATQPAWLTTLLQNAATLQLPTTSWRPGDPERTILAILSYALNFSDATVSGIAQAGFLDYAATGTVTYTLPDGTTVTNPVTPDPSKPSENPTGALGWLDSLASSVYNVNRITATYAGGPVAITNTSASTYGPFAARTYHVGCAFSKATYSNDSALTVPPSSVAGTGVAGVTSAGGLIKVQTSSNHGLSSGAAVAIIGVNGITPLTNPTAWYIDVVDATHFTLRGSSFAGSYTSGGKVYIPTVASFQADAAGSGYNSVDANGTPAVHTVTTAVTSLVGVSVDNLAIFQASDFESNTALAARCRLKLQSLSINGPAGAYSYAALSSQQLAPTLNPPQSVSAAITRCSVFADKLTGTTTVWIANAAGAPIAGDVTATDAVVQAYAVPTAVTATTKAATNLNVTAVADVWVPAALNTTATQALFQIALQAYIAALPIGGESDPGLAYTNVLPYKDALGSLFEAGALAKIPIANADLTLNGARLDIALSFSDTLAQVAVLSPATPTVTLHSV